MDYLEYIGRRWPREKGTGLQVPGKAVGELEVTAAIQAEEEEIRGNTVIAAHPWKGVRSRENKFTLQGCRGQGGRVVGTDFTSK